MHVQKSLKSKDASDNGKTRVAELINSEDKDTW